MKIQKKNNKDETVYNLDTHDLTREKQWTYLTAWSDTVSYYDRHHNYSAARTPGKGMEVNPQYRYLKQFRIVEASKEERSQFASWLQGFRDRHQAHKNYENTPYAIQQRAYKVQQDKNRLDAERSC